MKKFAEQLKKRAEAVRLSDMERDLMRERLLAYMDYHPLPEALKLEDRRIVRGVRGQLPSFMNAWFVGRFTGVAAMLLLVVVPALAENALPGDALYPIKVRFNEELRGAMTSSPYQKIEWETARLERRLAEAQLLADSGRLTEAAEVEVANAIKQHTEAARVSIDTIRQSDNDEATLAEITLSSALEVSAEVWTRRENSSTSSSTVFGAVSQAKAAIAPNPANENISYARLLSRVEAETTRAYEYLGSLNTVATDAEKSDINRRLNDLKVKIDSAVQTKDIDEAAASKQLADALGSARKLISFMTNLDVRRNVTIEELVPIVPTEEEKGAVVAVKIEDAARLVVEAEAGLSKIATSSNDHVAITETITQYREVEKSAREQLAAGDIANAELSAAAALEIAEALRQTMVGLGVSTTTEAKATSTPKR